MSKDNTTRFTIHVAYLDEGLIHVQVEGDPHPVGIYNETGWVLETMLRDAQAAIVDWRNSQRISAGTQS